MFQQMGFMRILLGLLLLSSTTWAAPVSLLSFQMGKLGALVQNTMSPIAQFSWTPRLETSPVSVRGELGLTLYKDPSGAEHPVINADVFAGFGVSFIMLEAGGGVQLWTGSFGYCPDLAGNLVFLLPSYVDRVYLGYARLFGAGDGIHLFKLGVGMKL